MRKQAGFRKSLISLQTNAGALFNVYRANVNRDTFLPVHKIWRIKGKNLAAMGFYPLLWRGRAFGLKPSPVWPKSEQFSL